MESIGRNMKVPSAGRPPEGGQNSRPRGSPELLDIFFRTNRLWQGGWNCSWDLGTLIFIFSFFFYFFFNPHGYPHTLVSMGGRTCPRYLYKHTNTRCTRPHLQEKHSSSVQGPVRPKKTAGPGRRRGREAWLPSAALRIRFPLQSSHRHDSGAG